MLRMSCALRWVSDVYMRPYTAKIFYFQGISFHDKVNITLIKKNMCPLVYLAFGRIVSMSDLPAPAPDPVLLAAEVCKELRCSLNKFYQLVAAGELSARKFGKRTVVLRSDLEAFKAQLQVFTAADLR